MVKRRDLKHVHENAVLQQFSDYLIDLGNTFKVLDPPDPPEAIIEINGRKTWLEITDAFLDKDHAIGLTTGASEDVKHISDSGRLVIDPDERFSSVIQSVIEAKYDKASMHSIYQSKGSGILLVGVFTPFASAADIVQSEANRISELVANKLVKVFDSIYVYDGTGQRSFHPIYSEMT
jgi:hypothetical protein